MRALLAALVLMACANPKIVVPAARNGVAIGTIQLPWSNVHVVFGRQPLIVDAGARGDFYVLATKLRELDAPLETVRCAVITHGHADHAGTARSLQRRGVTIIAGAADVQRLQRGEHGAHNPTGLFARMLSVILPEDYMPLTPDVLVTDRYDLAPCGIDGEAILVGGHTAGSLVVIVGGGKIALVGDLFRGGRLGGFVDTTEPMVHFFHDDKAKAHAAIRELLARGVELFVLGHGGPSTRAEVADTFGR